MHIKNKLIVLNNVEEAQLVIEITKNRNIRIVNRRLTEDIKTVEFYIGMHDDTLIMFSRDNYSMTEERIQEVIKEHKMEIITLDDFLDGEWELCMI